MVFVQVPAIHSRVYRAPAFLYTFKAIALEIVRITNSSSSYLHSSYRNTSSIPNRQVFTSIGI